MQTLNTVRSEEITCFVDLEKSVPASATFIDLSYAGRIYAMATYGVAMNRDINYNNSASAAGSRRPVIRCLMIAAVVEAIRVISRYRFVQNSKPVLRRRIALRKKQRGRRKKRRS